MNHSDSVISFIETAKEAALAAGALIREKINQPYEKEYKRHGELVTEIDKLAQEHILRVIQARYPEHGLIAEESPETHPQPGEPWRFPEGLAWIIDPIDGTSNFATSLPFFAVSIGLFKDGQPYIGAVYDPSRDEMFLAGVGHGATLNGKPLTMKEDIEMQQALVAGDWGWGYVGDKRLGSLNGLRSLAPHTRTVRVLGSAALGLCYVAAGRVDIYLAMGLHPWDVAAAAIIVAESGARMSAITEPWWPGSVATLAAHPDLADEAVGLVATAVE